MLLLSLLEASQTAVESSDQALKAAEAALTVAQTANKQAKEVLRAVTEAFVQENRKLGSTNIERHGQSELTVTKTSSMGNSDDFVEKFVMLSTNNNNIEDVEDDSPEHENTTIYDFLLISSTGPTADHFGRMFGFYHKTEEIKEECSVYDQEHDSQYGNFTSYRLTSDQGLWMLTRGDDVFAVLDDQELTVTGLSEKPSDCVITISLSRDVWRDIKEPGVAGFYRAEGSYHLGRPVFQHSGGRFTLYVGGGVEGGCWKVCTGVGGDFYLMSGSAPSQCPADPRAARNERFRKKHWLYESVRGGVTYSRGITVKCNGHRH